MKILNGAELAGYMKENQAHTVRRLKASGIQPKLVIIRDSDNPVILKYVTLKQGYGEDIGVVVEDWLRDDLEQAIREANEDPSVHGVIVQLPLRDAAKTAEIVSKITAAKDVDGLAAFDVGRAQDGANVENNYSSGDIFPDEQKPIFESATATAINWLLAGYDIKLTGNQIAIVGRGRLVGAPLAKMWRNSGYQVESFGHDSDLNRLKDFDIIISATGAPHLIKTEMVKSGAVVVDAGTASEGGVLVGDVDEAVRERKDLGAITPKIGGVGPLTVTALFEHTLKAAGDSSRASTSQ